MNGEEKLFNNIKKKLIPDLKKEEDEFSRYDCTSEELQMKIELKCRNQHYNYLILQRDKYEELIKYKNARYICSTPVSTYSFDIHKLKNIEWYWAMLPASTDFFNTNLILKEVTYLDVNEGKDIGGLLKN